MTLAIKRPRIWGGEDISFDLTAAPIDYPTNYTTRLSFSSSDI